MRRGTRGPLIVLLSVGLLGLGRFSRSARAVDVVGLFASGVLVGVSIARLIGSGAPAGDRHD
jgi:hypothetical protein